MGGPLSDEVIWPSLLVDDMLNATAFYKHIIHKEFMTHGD